MIGPLKLSREAEQESYIFFDKYIRPLPKNNDGSLNLHRAVLQHNDIDADKRKYEGVVLPTPKGEHSVVVLKESPTGANEVFFDFNDSKTMMRAEFVAAIVAGQYPGYAVRKISGVDYPVSKKDDSDLNNLG